MNQPALVRIRRNSNVVSAAVAVAVGSALGVLATLRNSNVTGPLHVLTEIPLPAFLAVVLGATAVVFTMRDWWVGLVVFLAWLPFEDLVRKFAGNDIRIYLIKDLLFVVALIGIGTRPRRERSWPAATGRAGIALALLVAWSAAMAVPAALDDPRVPIIGLRLDFLYVPLVVIGYFLAGSASRLRRSLAGLVVLASLVASLGLIQAVVGPKFLAPGRATPGLKNLVLIRGRGTVYQPTGTFVDPGRFTSMAIVTLVLALVAYAVWRNTPWRRWFGAAIVLSIVVVYMTGGKAAQIFGVLLLLAAVVGGRKRAAIPRALLAAVSVAGLVTVSSAVFPGVVSPRLSYYNSALNPVSSTNEWAFRVQHYSGSIGAGIRSGGLFGRGTGSQSLGLQYVYGGEQRNISGLYHLESGWGGVAYEIGLVGLALWVAWSVMWWRRIRRATRAVDASRYRRVAVVLSTWLAFQLFIGFFIGLQFFQNYLTNAFFWLFSGMVFGLPRLVASEADSEPVCASL